MENWKKYGNTINKNNQRAGDCIYYDWNDVQKRTCLLNKELCKCKILNNEKCENFEKGVL